MSSDCLVPLVSAMQLLLWVRSFQEQVPYIILALGVISVVTGLGQLPSSVLGLRQSNVQGDQLENEFRIELVLLCII